MSKRKYSPQNPCTNELQSSIFDSTNKKLTSNILDCNGTEIEIGHTVKLVFNAGDPHRRHHSLYDVIWKDAAYKVKSEFGKESFLGAIYHNVKIEVID